MSSWEEAELVHLGEDSPMSLAEVVKELLSRKIPGLDDICLEMLKVLIGIVGLTCFLNVVWRPKS